MGIVIRPHAGVGAPPVQQVSPRGVTEERGVNLLVHVFTGQLGEGNWMLGAVALVILVPFMDF